MMELLIDSFKDALLDTVKLIPFLLITYVIMEWLERKTAGKQANILKKAEKLGPLLGGVLGIVPQCGFSLMASNLYSGGVIGAGVLIAVFMSTSDEMLPIMLSNDAIGAGTIAKILVTKAVIAVITGYIVGFVLDRIRKPVEVKKIEHVHEHGDVHGHAHDKSLAESSQHAKNIVYKDMHGGNLHIEAKRGSDKMLIGHAKIRDFSIHNTPVLAKLLTVASFTGMVDLLTGEGMTFSHFDAPFKYKNSILYVNKARAYGNVLGISFGGAYNMSNDAISIEGMIAPAYGLNTMIGKIPLVGNLLAGKDGTIFAANYSISGTTDDANVRLNPLSALSPNSLKEAVASVFGKDEDDGF